MVISAPHKKCQKYELPKCERWEIWVTTAWVRWQPLMSPLIAALCRTTPRPLVHNNVCRTEGQCLVTVRWNTDFILVHNFSPNNIWFCNATTLPTKLGKDSWKAPCGELWPLLGQQPFNSLLESANLPRVQFWNYPGWKTSLAACKNELLTNMEGWQYWTKSIKAYSHPTNKQEANKRRCPRCSWCRPPWPPCRPPWLWWPRYPTIWCWLPCACLSRHIVVSPPVRTHP